MLHARKASIGVLLADDRHRHVRVNGKPVTARVTVTSAMLP
jgi:hypothetical protein